MTSTIEKDTSVDPAGAEGETSSVSSILIVDDDEHVGEVTARMLRTAGVDVWVAHDMKQAVGFAQSNDFDVLVLDAVLPGVGSRNIVDELQEHQLLPVLYISGHAPERLDCSDQPRVPTGTLEKPFNRAQLIKAIATLLEP